MPGTGGCPTTVAPSTNPPHKICCLAMSAKCLACKSGESVDEYCRKMPGTGGCPATTPAASTNAPVCCKAATASCLACLGSETIDEFCKKMPETIGCPMM